MVFSSQGTYKETIYLYIDGGYLRGVIRYLSERYFGQGILMDIDYSKIKTLNIEKAFYYDYLPIKKNHQDENEYAAFLEKQKELFRNIKMFKGFHVREGVMEYRKSRDNEQDQIDMLIAIDMLTNSMKENMDKVILLTGDLEFKPLIDALVGLGMYVILWYELTSTDINLIYSSDERIELNIDSIYNWATEDFKNRHKIPYRKSYMGYNLTEEIGNSIHNKTIIEKGILENGNNIYLYMDNNAIYTVIITEGEDKFTKIEYKDFKILEFYMKDVGYDYVFNHIV